MQRLQGIDSQIVLLSKKVLNLNHSRNQNDLKIKVLKVKPINDKNSQLLNQKIETIRI